MNHSRRFRVPARKVFGALVVLALLATALWPTAAQPVRPLQRPAPAPSPSPTTTPTPDPHAGHAMPQPTPTPQLTPTPQPSPRHDHPPPSPQGPDAPQHDQHAPAQQPAATPTPAASPAPAVEHHSHQPTAPQTPVRRRARSGLIPEGPILTLGELERMAEERNPTIAQSHSLIRAAEGRRRQAGAFPNPLVGYFAEELSFRAPGETSEHGVFVEQTIPLGGKLGKARRVFEREREQAEALAAAQRLRVLNSVRALYFETLGAQQLVELRADLADLSREAVEITAELFNIGQADRPDQLEIEIEAERAEIEMLRAQGDWEQAWRALGAMVGDPELRPARLAGSLEEAGAALDEAQLVATTLSASPEIRTARAGVERARAMLSRQRAERIPDLFVSGGVGYNLERFEPSAPGLSAQRKGYEARLEVGVNVPIFNRNRGGIAAAEAELAIAERELERLQLALRTRLTSSFRQYRNARTMVEKYRTQVIPRARRAYEMYLSNFRQMAASYPQVLIAQRTLFQVEVEYARALVELRRSAMGLRGFLLEGGLDPIGRPGEGGERTEGFTLGAGDSDDR